MSPARQQTQQQRSARKAAETALEHALANHELASRQAVSWLVIGKDLPDRWARLRLSPEDFHTNIRDIANASANAPAGTLPLEALAEVAGIDLAFRAGEIAARESYIPAPAGLHAYGLRRSRLEVDLARANLAGDAIKAGDVARELAKLEAAGKIPTPQQSMEIITAADILDMQFRESPLIDGLLDERESLLACGPSGIGKSLFTIALALALADPPEAGLWGLFPIPRAVRTVFVQSENTAKATRKRLSKIVEASPELRPALDSLFFPRLSNDVRLIGNLEDVAFQDSVSRILDTTKAGLLVLDPLISYAGEDENDNRAMRRALDCLTAVCDRTGAACVLVHHQGKGDTKTARGASAIEDWAANTLILKPQVDNGHRTQTLKVEHKKARNFETRAPFCLERTPDLLLLRIEDSQNKGGQTRIDTVLRCLREKGGRADTKLELEQAVADSLRMGRSTAQRAIDEARKEGLISSFPSSAKREGYQLAQKCLLPDGQEESQGKSTC